LIAAPPRGVVVADAIPSGAVRASVVVLVVVVVIVATALGSMSGMSYEGLSADAAGVLTMVARGGDGFAKGQSASAVVVRVDVPQRRRFVQDVIATVAVLTGGNVALMIAILIAPAV